MTDEVRGQRPPAGRPVSGPYGKAGEFPVFRRGRCPHPPASKCSDLPVGDPDPPASLPTLGGKDDSPYQGEMSRRDKRGRGARRAG